MSMEEDTVARDRILAARIRTAVEELHHALNDARRHGLSIELGLLETCTLVSGKAQRVTFKIVRPIDYSRDVA